MNSVPQTHARLVAFHIGAEEYVIDAMRVRQILRVQPLTPVRQGPKFLEGVLTLQGLVVPIVDMRKRFELPPIDEQARRIVIVMVEGRTLGILVDRVSDILSVAVSQIKPAPAVMGPRDAPFFLGVCEHRERTLILLNLKTILSSDESIFPPRLIDVVGQNSDVDV